MTDETATEQATAEAPAVLRAAVDAVVSELPNIASGNDDGPGDAWTVARAVIEAVEPYHTITALEATVRAIEQFAARKRRAGHRRDAVGIDEAAELVLDELRALRARQSLSRPTAEETQ